MKLIHFDGKISSSASKLRRAEITYYCNFVTFISAVKTRIIFSKFSTHAVNAYLDSFNIDVSFVSKCSLLSEETNNIRFRCRIMLTNHSIDLIT